MGSCAAAAALTAINKAPVPPAPSSVLQRGSFNLQCHTGHRRRGSSLCKIAFSRLALLWYDLLFCSQVALSWRQGPLSLISTRIHSSSSRSLIFSAKCKLPTPSNKEIWARAGCPALLVSCGSGCGVSLRYDFLNCALINYHAAGSACQSQLAVSPDTAFKMQCQGRDIPALLLGWWLGECSPAPHSLAMGLVCWSSMVPLAVPHVAPKPCLQ